MTNTSTLFCSTTSFGLSGALKILIVLSISLIIPNAVKTNGTQGQTQNAPPPKVVMGVLSLTPHHSFYDIIAKKFNMGLMGDFHVAGLERNPKANADVISNDPVKGTRRLMSGQHYAAHMHHFLHTQMQTSSTWSYIPNSYRRFLDSYENVETKALDVRWPDWKLAEAIEHLDGVLFTGGSSALYQKRELEIDVINKGKKGKLYAMKLPTMYMAKVRSIMEMAKAINKRGKEFVLWGMCLGFESMIVGQASYTFALDNFDGDSLIMHNVVGIKTPVEPKANKNQLKRTDDGITERFEQFVADEIYPLKDKKFFHYCHKYGVTLSNFMSDPILKKTVVPLAVSDTHDFEQYETDFSPNPASTIQAISEIETKDTTFVSILRFREYPFYATQFHPEKPLYDYLTNPAVGHSAEIQAVNKRFSDFLVNKLRKAKLRNLKKGFVSKSPFGAAVKFSVDSVGIYEKVQVFY